MARQQLNLGILAHVDAGKTTLTERLLYEAGVIMEIGSVDAGTTQTDTLALERQRGITIKSAVAAFRPLQRQGALQQMAATERSASRRWLGQRVVALAEVAASR